MTRLWGTFSRCRLIGIMVVTLSGLASTASVRVAEAQDTPPFYSTTPILETWEFELDIAQDKALDRAREALKAADLNLLTRTPISDGGTTRFLYVIIHCRSCGGKTPGDVAVASYPGHDDERRSVGTFLRDYMVTGRKPAAQSSTAVSFTGEWQTTWMVLTMKQEGNRVTGTYTHADGKLEGTLTGNVLRFQWTQSNGKGAGTFVLSQDGKSFNGYWSYTDNPDDRSGGAWDGTRK